MADLVGTVAAKDTISGSLNVVYGKDGASAYEVALTNGFEGTEAEWLLSLKGEQGVSGVYVGSGEMPEGYNVQIDPDGTALTIAAIVEAVKKELNASAAKIGYVDLPAANWVDEDNNLHSQIVTIEGVTERSQVDLTPNVEQLAIFYEKDLTFVTENEGGIVTVYAIGQKPQNDYTIQVTITETERVSIDA